MGGGRSRQNAAGYNQPYNSQYGGYGGQPGYNTIITPPTIYETPYEEIDYTEIYVPTVASGVRRPVIYVAAPFPSGGLGGFGGGLGGLGGGLGGFGGGLGGLGGGLGGYGGGLGGLGGGLGGYGGGGSTYVL